MGRARSGEGASDENGGSASPSGGVIVTFGAGIGVAEGDIDDSADIAGSWISAAGSALFIVAVEPSRTGLVTALAVDAALRMAAPMIDPDGVVDRRFHPLRPLDESGGSSSERDEEARCEEGLGLGDRRSPTGVFGVEVGSPEGRLALDVFALPALSESADNNPVDGPTPSD